MPHGVLLRQVTYVIMMKSLILGQINLNTSLLQETQKVILLINILSASSLSRINLDKNLPTKKVW